MPRNRLQLRSVRRGVEQRLHGVRPPAGRCAPALAGAVDRHGDGPRAHHGGHPGQALELRHGPLHAHPRSHRAARRPALRGEHRRTGRRVHARHRGSSARDDVPHRRRGRAVQRMARLRAPEDHASGDAAREEARFLRTGPPRSRRRRRHRDVRCLSGARTEPRRHRPRRAQRGREIRRRADGRSPPPRGGARSRGRGRHTGAR